MNPTIANFLVLALAGYLGLGLLVAIPFVLRGVNRLDSSTQGGSIGFRLAILPGAMALWPWALKRWLSGKQPPEENNPHRAAARQRGNS